MQAIIFNKYGTTDELVLKEIKKPTPKDNQVLVKVCAASVNSWDWELMHGKPFVNRMMFGILKPKINSLGADIAGVVESLGKDVKSFKIGDHVFGDLSTFGGINKSGWGGFAEYVCADEGSLVFKPSNLTFEDAAATPQAAVMALQGLQSIGHIHKGQKILINGGGGGVGTFAIMMAKSFETEVTAVDTTEKLDVMRLIGANHVIDFTKEDFTKSGKTYDLVLDTAMHHSVSDSFAALRPKGIYVIVGGSNTKITQAMFLMGITSLLSSKKMVLLGLKQNKNLDLIGELIVNGKIKPAIDKRFTLEEVPKALKYFGDGHAKGKLIITFKE